MSKKSFAIAALEGDLTSVEVLRLHSELSKIIESKEYVRDFKLNRGIHFEQCISNGAKGLDELAFSDVIKSKVEGGGFPLAIQGRLGTIGMTGALTLFQWLASDAGARVLDEALELTGKKVVCIM